MDCRKKCSNFNTCRFTEEGSRADHCNFLIPLPPQPAQAEESSLGELANAVKNIRDSDCGGWMKNGVDGEPKRIEMMKLLDKLYKAAGV